LTIVFHPNFSIVGGFSITSTPQQFAETQTFELAIKQAYVNPIVKWLHNTAQVGDYAQVRVGGNFFLKKESVTDAKGDGQVQKSLDQAREILLLAGGVGITPLIAMAGQIMDTIRSSPTHANQQQQQATQSTCTLESFLGAKHATMLVTAKDVDELLFKDRLLNWSKDSRGFFDVQFFVTRDSKPATMGSMTTSESQQGSSSQHPHQPLETTSDATNSEGGNSIPHENLHLSQRITKETLESYIHLSKSRHNGADPLIYMCGPADFEKAVVGYLKELGHPEDLLKFEQWW
jgi:ferredoxin-NADP reductase